EAPARRYNAPHHTIPPQSATASLARADHPYPVWVRDAGGQFLRMDQGLALNLDVRTVHEDAPRVCQTKENMFVLEHNQSDRKSVSSRKAAVRLNAVLMLTLRFSGTDDVKRHIIAELTQTHLEGGKQPPINPAIASLAGAPVTYADLQERRRTFARQGKNFDEEHTGKMTLLVWLAAIIFRHPGRRLTIEVTTQSGTTILKGLTALEHIERLQ
ncbi:MAG TPA: hypothetical protein V6D17_14470, partial [Candidatus Obscuribacterales bacterium]